MAYEAQLDLLRRNMQTHNQKVLMDRPIATASPKYLTGAGLHMGNRPRGTTTDNRIAYPSAGSPNAAYSTDTVWTHMVPWFVIWPGERHYSVNTQLVINYIKYAFFSDQYTGWVVTTHDAGFGNKHLPHISAGTVNDPVDYTYDGSEKKAYYNFTSNLNPIHGWKTDRVLIPNPQNLKCVYVEIAATLALIDDQGVDDRNSSEIMMNAAADYYPADVSMTNIPMVGCSWFSRIHNGLSKINFATVSPPGAEWFRNSDYKGPVSITEEEFIATDPTFLPTA